MRCCSQTLPTCAPTQVLLSATHALALVLQVRDAWWVLLGRAREKPCRVTLSPDLVRDAAVLNRGKNGNFFNTTFCPPIASWVDADPEMDAVMRRCTGGMPWTTVPVGTNFVGIQQAYPKSILINTIFKCVQMGTTRWLGSCSLL